MSTAMRRHRPGSALTRGFTLLEVLGAVAILGIWYFILAALATDGLMHEGQNLRRLRAGIIADRVLAELEAINLDGSVPEPMNEIERAEGEEDEIYEIQKEVSVFTLHFGAAKAPGERADRDPSAPVPALPALIGEEIPGFARHIHRVDVTVSWSEGFETPEEVHRTTYLFDLAKAAEAYESEETADDEDNEDGEDETESELDEDEELDEEDEE